MKQRLTVLAMLLAIASALVLAPFSASAAPSAAPTAAGITTAVTGTATNALGQLVNFAGNVNVTRFAVQNGSLVAIGTLTGTLTNTVTGVVQNVTQQITLPVTNITGTCDILNLVLGPLDLNLLGLHVALNQVNLLVEAIPGAGNLLGNLLCSVANLLNGGLSGPLGNLLTAITNLLNGLLGSL